jgi:hypothetical protein
VAVKLDGMTSSPLQQQPTKAPATRGAKIFGGIMVLAVLVLCVGGVAAFVFRGGSDKAPADRTLEARSMCETFVKRQLKAPATAKFSEESAAKVSDAEYTAGGSVDSQNSFGALLRATFVCDMTYDAGSEVWTSKAVSVVPA